MKSLGIEIGIWITPWIFYEIWNLSRNVHWDQKKLFDDSKTYRNTFALSLSYISSTQCNIGSYRNLTSGLALLCRPLQALYALFTCYVNHLLCLMWTKKSSSPVVLYYTSYRDLDWSCRLGKPALMSSLWKVTKGWKQTHVGPQGWTLCLWPLVRFFPQPVLRSFSTYRIVSFSFLAVTSVSDTKSQGQPACQEEQKKWRNEDVNVRAVWMWCVIWGWECTYCMNVMCNMRMWMYVWMWCTTWICATAVYYNEIFAVHLWEATWGEKTLGETWAAVIRTINSILRTSVDSNCAFPRMGTEPRSVYGQKGTMKDVLARCLKKTEAQVCTLSIHVCCL